MPGAKCTAISLGPPGKLLAKSAPPSQLSTLDGYSIENLSLPEASCGRVYEGPSGQLWTLLTNGPAELKDGQWLLRNLSPRSNSTNQICIDLFPVRQGRVLVLQSEALVQVDAKLSAAKTLSLTTPADQPGLGNFCGLAPSRDGTLWVSTQHGLRKATVPARNLNSSSTWQSFLLPGTLNARDLLNPRESDDGSLTTVASLTTNGEKLILVFDGKNWRSYPTSGMDVRHAWKGVDRALWAMSSTALARWDPLRGAFTEVTEPSASQYFDVALEPGGTFWLATSAGLYRFSPALWQHPEESRGSISSLVADAEGAVWGIEPKGLVQMKGEEAQGYAWPDSGLSFGAISKGVFALKNGDLLVDAGNQLLQFSRETGEFHSPKFGSRPDGVKPLGVLKDGSLCLQQSGTAALETQYQLFSYDGREFKQVSESVPEPLMGSELSVLFVSHNGEIWIGGERGVAVFKDRLWRPFVSSDGSTPESPVGFTELPDGKIWSATSDSVWEFNGKNWYPLRRGFEGISSILRTRDGSVWVASNNGVNRFFQGHWIENGIEEGLPDAAVRDLCEDSLGRLWAATARGASQFHPEADPDAPRASIQNRRDGERRFQEGAFLNLSFAAKDKWKYTASSRLFFSFRLDEHDWSPFQDNASESLPDLAAGKHSFQVRAMDRNCNISPAPEQIDFMVMLPWYRERRLVMITVGALAVVIFFATLAFNRHRTLVRSHAEIELKVASRTRELELANRQLLHSQKMNALGALAAGIAHDFNNILSIIKGSTQIIEENLDDPKKVATRLDRIKTVVEQGSGVVKAMLGFSRESETEAALCDVNAAVEDTIRLLGDRFLRETNVQFRPAADLPPIRCSRDFVQQILLNFIFNAAEASSSRKEIIVSTGLSALPVEGLVLPCAAAEACVTISVEDFGCGIATENLSRIFEPFFTTKALSARRGTGLGLSMVYELAKKLEAGLGVKSVPGQGSRFTLVLPVREVKQPAADECAELSAVAKL